MIVEFVLYFSLRVITGSPGDRGVRKPSPGMWWEGRRRVRMNEENAKTLGRSKSTADFQLDVTYLLIDIYRTPIKPIPRNNTA